MSIFHFVILARIGLFLSCLFSIVDGIVRFGHQSATLAAYHHRELHSLAHEVVRERFITLPDLRPLKSVGELIEFELFDGMVVLGDVKEVMVRDEESSSWTGQLKLSTGNILRQKIHCEMKDILESLL